MGWTDEMVNDLKKMWAQGLTTGEIGRRLSVSKNSVVGKVHRLKLDGRPSPIKRKEDKAPAAKTAPKDTKEVKAAPTSVVKPAVKEAPKTAPVSSTPSHPATPSYAAPKVKVEAAPQPKAPESQKSFNFYSGSDTSLSSKRYEDRQELMSTYIVNKEKPKDGKLKVTDLDNHTCRWPLGDPKDDNFHFCGKKVRTGQTYCEEHSIVAYVKAAKK